MNIRIYTLEDKASAEEIRTFFQGVMEPTGLRTRDGLPPERGRQCDGQIERSNIYAHWSLFLFL